MIMASEVSSDLRIELSDLNYPDIHVHIAYKSNFVWPLRSLRPPNDLKGHI